jgi:hypothetical protein
LLRVMLPRLTLWSMVSTTTRDTILQTVSIQSGQHLWRLS